ncbi:MAG: membrane or secreted protein [Flavobacteriales bacterium]|nr:membrane or secreted protein [Flavobacteriales bacterium]|tara:strand:+ start:1311 stop:1511 length:201 start_codon:yes stop_codon:yes gene_type:complete
MKMILLTIGFLAIAFLGIAVKLIFKKDGEFSGTCASKNPVLNQENEPCSLCGAQPGDKCDSDTQAA